MNLANPKVRKHQYFHVPAHVARRHRLAWSIDEPERRPLGRSTALGFLIAGWRTQRDSNPQPPTAPTSLSTRRVLCRWSYVSCDSFLVYQLGEPDPGMDRRPLLTAEISVFGVAQNPRLSRERIVRRSCLRTGGILAPTRHSCHIGSLGLACQFPGKTDRFSCPSSPCWCTVCTTWGFTPSPPRLRR